MKDYAEWKFVTSDELLSQIPCELIYAKAISDDNAPADNKIYDGENTSGKLIINLQTGVKDNIDLNPSEPIYCRVGLYVDVGDNTEGVFVMWRILPTGY